MNVDVSSFHIYSTNNFFRQRQRNVQDLLGLRMANFYFVVFGTILLYAKRRSRRLHIS